MKYDNKFVKPHILDFFDIVVNNSCNCPHIHL